MDTEVLIVGAGPVGLTTSILVQQLGISCRVVERRAGLHQAPQAHVVTPRTMEIFRAAGVEETALRAAASKPEDVASVQWVHTLAGPELGRITLLEPERIAKVMSATPTPPANISQDRLEPLLLEHARSVDVPVDFGSAWQGCSVDDDFVRSRVSSGGDQRVITSRWVLGCDGAASAVRRQLGIAMVGPERIQTFVNVFFRANLRSVVEGRPAVLYWHMDVEEPGVFIAHDIDSTWIYMSAYDPDARTAESFTPQSCEPLLRRAIGADVDFDIVSTDTWVMTAQIAEQYAKPPLFLIGDAAHRFPPTGGLGMNTGIADGFNLAWKLAAVRDGRAGSALLDTYGTERRAVAQRNSDESLANAQKMMEVVVALGVPPGASPDQARAAIRGLPEDEDGIARVRAAIANQGDHFDTTGLDLGHYYDEGALVPDGSEAPVAANPVADFVPSTRPGSRLPHAWVERSGERISTIDLVDRRMPILLAGSEGEGWCEAAAALGLPTHRFGTDLADPDGSWSALCGIGNDGALVVRPDGHVGFRAPRAAPDPKSALVEALDRILAR